MVYQTKLDLVNELAQYVTKNDSVKNAPGENKWNAMSRLFGHDDDEITCANVNDGTWWLCSAINIDM